MAFFIKLGTNCIFYQYSRFIIFLDIHQKPNRHYRTSNRANTLDGQCNLVFHYSNVGFSCYTKAAQTSSIQKVCNPTNSIHRDGSRRLFRGTLKHKKKYKQFQCASKKEVSNALSFIPQKKQKTSPLCKKKQMFLRLKTEQATELQLQPKGT